MANVSPLFESRPDDVHLDCQLRENGYLFFRELMSSDEIGQCRQKVNSVLAKLGWIQGLDTEECSSAVNRINSPEFYRCISQLMKIQEIHQLAYCEKLGQLMEKLIGGKPYAHPRKMIRISYPFEQNPKDLIPPHQDIFYVKGEVDTFTAWIPLGNYTVPEGGLMIAEKSHKESLLPTKANDEGRFGCQLADGFPTQRFKWLQSDYRMGDCIIFHSLTLHRAAPNLTRKFRLSIDCRFSSATGFINEDQLLPPYFPHVEGWDELTKGWSTPDMFLKPDSIKVQDSTTPVEKVIQLASQFITKPEKEP